MVHSLKASSANLGAMYLYSLCQELEMAGSNADLSEVEAGGDLQALQVFQETKSHIVRMDVEMLNMNNKGGRYMNRKTSQSQVKISAHYKHIDGYEKIETHRLVEGGIQNFKLKYLPTSCGINFDNLVDNSGNVVLSHLEITALIKSPS